MDSVQDSPRPLISGMLRAGCVLLLACSANADYAYDPDPGATPWLVKFIILLVVCTVIAIVVLIVLRHANHGRALAAPILPTEQRALNHPGRFQIIGVDRETKLDTRWTVDAESAENAKVKAELEGIIVTSVSQIVG